MEFGEKLRQAREQQGMTQQTLADKLYVTRQAVSRWECGARYPDLLTAKCLSDILHVSMDDLLSGDELTRYAEKQPLLESAKAEKIHFALFAVLSILSGICFFRYLLYLPISVHYDKIERFYLWRELLTYGPFFTITLFAVVKLLKQDTTPRMVGLIGSIFFVIDAVREGMNAVGVFLQKPFFPATLILLSLCSVVIAVMIWLYFTQGKNQLQWTVAGCCAATVLYRGTMMVSQAVSIYMNDFVDGAYLGLTASLLPLAITAVVSVLILYQMRVLRRKRKLAA